MLLRWDDIKTLGFLLVLPIFWETESLTGGGVVVPRSHSLGCPSLSGGFIFPLCKDESC